MVQLARETGLEAQRTWQTAQSPDAPSRKCDVVIGGQPFQVKLQGDGFSAIYRALEGVAGVFIRQDHQEWLVVMPAEDFLLYLKSAKEHDDPTPKTGDRS